MITCICVLTCLLILIAFLPVDTSNIRKLANDGWVLYHSPYCGYCIKQLSDIGYFKLKLLPTVNCSDNSNICREKGITSYPTWLNERTKQIHVGYIQLDPVTKDDIKLIDTLSRAPIHVVKSIDST